MPKASALQPRKQVKQRRAAETRERILVAAARVFAEHGYAAGTTNRMAEAAGVSIGSLYQYYPNKDAILVELVHRHVDAGVAIVQGHLRDGRLPEGLEAQVRLFVRATIENHLDEPALHRVLFEEAPRPPELLATLHRAEAWLVAATERALERSPEVAVTDRSTAARLVVATIESVVHRWFASRRPVARDRFEDELTAMLTGYLRGAGRARAPRADGAD